MPYATHRIVGVIELDQSDRYDSSQQFDRISLAAASTSSNALVRQIRSEVSEALVDSRLPFEPTLQVNTAELVRGLDAEFAAFRTAHIAC